MHPYLFTLPGGTMVPSWGVIISLTVVGTIYLGHRWVQRDGGYPKDMVLELGILIFVMHTVGGRIGFLRANWGEFQGDWKKMLDVTSGGSAFLESFLLITISFAGYLWWRKINIWNFFDLCAPLVPFGQTLGRTACIFSGCCYGRPSDVPWAFTFTNPESLVAKATQGAYLHVPLHPVQIYEICATGVLLVFLFWYRPRRRFRGEVALLYLTLSPVLRFITDFFRGDAKRGWFLEEHLGQVLSKPQGVALCMLVVMAVAWYIVPRLPGAGNLDRAGGFSDDAESDSSPGQEV
jgi:phosphatidylglycerol:prolipoprotein diacylglycerol transferase